MRTDRYADDVLGGGNLVDTAVRAGAAIAKPITLSTEDADEVIEGVVLPQGYNLRSLERFRETPSTKRGSQRFFDASSFARYVNDHKSDGTRIAYTHDGGGDAGHGRKLPSVRAILDHHSSKAPGWSRHFADLLFKVSRPMAAWLSIDGNPQSQADLAEFLEERVGDIAEPAGATILEVVRRFEVTRTGQFASTVDLVGGTVNLMYAETDKAPSEQSFPATFTLGLSPFDGDKPYRVTARLRYRVNAGRLAITVKLLQVDELFEQAVRDRVAEVQKVTTIEPYFGVLGGCSAIKASGSDDE